MLNDTLAKLSGAIGGMFFWLPAWAAGTLLMLVTFGIAASTCRFVIRLLRRYTARFGRYPALVMARCQGPTGAMFVLFALGVVLPITPFSDGVATLIGHMLLAASVVAVGWSAINTIDLFADMYVQRLHLDVEDNLRARKHVTQVGILRGAVRTLIILLTIAVTLMTSESVRQYGVSLFASAGAAGLVVGLAARPLLSNLLAGIQIAITQPIRLEDAVIVEGEWGWIEKIASTYVVVRLWDLRRMILPLSYFIETPFQNWTYQNADLLGSVMLHVDYSVPVAIVRKKLQEIVASNGKWDGKVAGVQMTDLPENMVELRVLVSARNAPLLFDLRCDVREALTTWLFEAFPDALPKQRNDVSANAITMGAEQLARPREIA